jgi:hypothetical protein
MNEERKNTGRTIYDEKQVCGRCSNTIIGVVSRVRETDGKPLCRDCIFELDQHARKSGGRVIVEETTAPLTREEKIRRTILWSASLSSSGALRLSHQYYNLTNHFEMAPTKPTSLRTAVLNSYGCFRSNSRKKDFRTDSLPVQDPTVLMCWCRRRTIL